MRSITLQAQRSASESALELRFYRAESDIQRTELLAKAFNGTAIDSVDGKYLHAMATQSLVAKNALIIEIGSEGCLVSSCYISFNHHTNTSYFGGLYVWPDFRGLGYGKYLACWARLAANICFNPTAEYCITRVINSQRNEPAVNALEYAGYQYLNRIETFSIQGNQSDRHLLKSSSDGHYDVAHLAASRESLSEVRMRMLKLGNLCMAESHV